MFDAKTSQLNGLRDALKRNGRMYSDVGRLMEEFVLDDDLRRLFGMDYNEDYFPKAVWYCICNNNADRDMLILKLNVYFSKYTRKSQVGELIKYALFLGGVDYQLNDIEPSSRGSESIAKRAGGKGETVIKRNPKKLVPIALGLVALLIPILLIVKSNHSDKPDPDVLRRELHGSYEGSISYRKGHENIRMDYTFYIECSNDLIEVRLFRESVYFKGEPNDEFSEKIKDTYSARIKNDILKLYDGPDLTISKTELGKLKLACDKDGNGFKWALVKK